MTALNLSKILKIKGAVLRHSCNQLAYRMFGRFSFCNSSGYLFSAHVGRADKRITNVVFWLVDPAVWLSLSKHLPLKGCGVKLSYCSFESIQFANLRFSTVLWELKAELNWEGSEVNSENYNSIQLEFSAKAIHFQLTTSVCWECWVATGWEKGLGKHLPPSKTLHMCAAPSNPLVVSGFPTCQIAEELFFKWSLFMVGLFC